MIRATPPPVSYQARDVLKPLDQAQENRMTQRVSSALVALPDKPHALYRFFDRTDTLLYVGITVDIGARFHDHRSKKPWWMNSARIEIEHFGTRDEALAAEAQAIRKERPLYNVTHNDLVNLPSQPPASAAALDPESITAEWLTENWGKVPQAVRDCVEIPAHQAGIEEFAQTLADRFDDEVVQRNAATAVSLLDEDEDQPDEGGRLALGVEGAVDALMSDYYRLKSEVRELLDRIDVKMLTSARASALTELGANMPDFNAEDEFWNTVRHVGLTVDRNYLRGMADHERNGWIRAVMNKRPDLLGDELFIPAAQLARSVKVHRAIPLGYCAGLTDSAPICPDRATVVLTLKGCLTCARSANGNCSGHLMSCEVHAAVTKMAGGVFSDAFGAEIPVLSSRVAPINPDPWSVG
ncbi:GIY-YIG nuclease family protein [Micromonospora sp. NPDC053740]|uniref:GIY-YIG nuclease family protein n=1 Tax=Micromonospora sp. NPDC053740 TaxID=3155173 RepID=UPI00343E29D9